ncbi:MAG TPA: S-layer homology domain-containing protein [Thermoanaerobaculia bacterium]|nr:S-layer homology domain-containing protein [Thermoanaerobaculia bacterium]
MKPLGLVALLLGAAAAAAQTIDEFPIPTDASSPQGITAGPDGNLWFVEQAADKIGRMTLSGTFTEFPVSVAVSGASLFGITSGPDGNLWFSDLLSKKVGKIATDGTITEYPVDLPHPFTSGDIVTGADGALWFTANSGFFNPRMIGRADTSGNTVTYDLWSSPCCAGPIDGPFGIAAGSDGALWFTAGRDIGRIEASGFASGVAYLSTGFAGAMIAAGPDGNLWFTETNSSPAKVARITTGGVLTEFSVPTSGGVPSGITAAPDGNLWFTESSGNKIGRITPFGAVTEFPLPTQSAGPAKIAPGPDGAIWFTESAANQIGRITVASGTPPAVGAVSPASGLATGGTAITLTGSGFVAGAAVHIGDVSATGVDVVDSGTITATTPSLPAGRVFDVVVTNPDTGSGTLPEGWYADFADVPQDHPYHAAVEAIVRARITAGCGGGVYCPSDLVDRSSIAKFLLRGAHGRYYLPPYASGPGYYKFTDVDSTNPLYRWIYELAAEGITTGCGPTLYCPDATVNRASMAVFLLRGKNGSSFVPPAATGTVFADVQTTTYLARWIEALGAAGITSGCGGGNFCPDQPVTRGEMAKFLKRTFLP